MLVVAFLNVTTACGQSIRVATYNLNWGNRRGDAVLDAINTARPDLICFQETTVQSERFLRERLTQAYPYFHSVGHEGRYAAERFAFASKFELRDLEFVPPEAGLFGFYSAKLQLAGRSVHIINVHLTPFHVPRGSGVLDAMAALSTTEDKHALEIDAIAETISAEQPTLVLGDFNSISTFLAPGRFAELGFRDAFASLHREADSHPTWHWPTRPLPLALRIDYIFHSPHFAATEATVIRREGSDHSLVVAEIDLLRRTQPAGPTQALERATGPGERALPDR